MQIEIKGEQFILLEEKAVYWVSKQTLLISDLHIGKVTHFRNEGIAIPAAAAAENFERLDELISRCNPKRILFLGDLFHNKYNAEWETFAAWREQHHYISMRIVLGNHDILPLSLFLENDIDVCIDDYHEDDFIFTHHPKETEVPGKFIFAGHIHPVFHLAAKGRQYHRLPCFFMDTHQAILPSFGVFTGGFCIGHLPGREIFVWAKTKVFRVPS